MVHIFFVKIIGLLKFEKFRSSFLQNGKDCTPNRESQNIFLNIPHKLKIWFYTHVDDFWDI